MILEWADQNGYVLLSHDASTMINFVNDRLQNGQSIAGLIEVPQTLSIGQAVEDIYTIVECSNAKELINRVLFLPL